jgi:energy-coupling factor transport system ATP-binding protein
MAIRVEHLTLIYNSGLAYETKAVDDVSFAIDDGAFVAIIGHTGSGKSTLIQQLNGILKPSAGKVYIDGLDITAKEVKKGRRKGGADGLSLADIRKQVGLVFQYPEYQLFDETVFQDVSFGPRNLGLDAAEIDVRVREAMEMVGMPPSVFGERSPFELSGGQKRRIAIAGVVAMRPKILILDEPTAGLDPKAHADILSMVRTIRERTGSTVILVSHNMGDVAELADRVLVMDRGRLVRDGSPKQVFADGNFLRTIGLGLPPAAQMAELLCARGFQTGSDVFTLQTLTDRIATEWAAEKQRKGAGA